MINLRSDSVEKPVSTQSIAEAVIIDPGHGGADAGAVFKGVCEDEIAYDISVRIYKKLKAKKHAVFITLKDNHFPAESNKLICSPHETLWNNKPVTLKNRIALIEEIDPDEKFFILSIHVNALPAFMKGYSLYYPPENELRKKNSLSAAQLISYKMAQDGLCGLSVSWNRVLIPLKPIRSRFYRINFTPALFSKTGNRNVVLVETGNLRNNTDRSNLLKAAYRERIAAAIAQAAADFIGK